MTDLEQAIENWAWCVGAGWHRVAERWADEAFKAWEEQATAPGPQGP